MTASGRRPRGGAARAAQVACVGFVALLAVLHVIKPELEPSWHFISEYAIGEQGWLMSLAFFSLALAYVALTIAVAPHVPRLSGRIGLALLVIGAAGLTLAGIFPMDPLLTSPEAATTSGKIHNVGGTLGIALPLAAAIVSWKLYKNPAWASARRSVARAGVAVVVTSIATMVAFGVLLSHSGGRFGPDVPIGWPNRLDVLVGCAWLFVVARAASTR